MQAEFRDWSGSRHWIEVVTQPLRVLKNNTCVLPYGVLKKLGEVVGSRVLESPDTK